jgi:hypothetical protein
MLFAIKHFIAVIVMQDTDHNAGGLENRPPLCFTDSGVDKT